MQAHKVKILRAAAIIFAVLLLAPSCSVLNAVKEIRVTSCSVISITPRSFRSADAVLALGVSNPAFAFTLTDVEGHLRRGETVLAVFNGGPIAVESRCDKVYELPCGASIGEGVSLVSLISLLGDKDLSAYAVDIAGDVTLANGKTRRLKINDIPLESLMGKGASK